MDHCLPTVKSTVKIKQAKRIGLGGAQAQFIELTMKMKIFFGQGQKSDRLSENI